nr:unnamed protein product [Spirometra erinaceieuropaei]
MARQPPDGIIAHVMDNGSISEAFTVTNGVSRTMSLMLMDTYRDERPGIHIACITDRHLLNSKHMLARQRLPTTTVHDLLFADDCALSTTTEVEMQVNVDFFTVGCANFGLTINRKKKLVMRQPSPNTQPCTPPRITATATNSKPKHTFHQHQDRRRRDAPDPQCQPSPRTATELRVESSQPLTEYRTGDVQGRRPDNTSIRGGHLHHLLQFQASATSSMPALPTRNPRTKQPFGHLWTQCATSPSTSTPSPIPIAVTDLAPITADHIVAVPQPPSVLPQPLHRLQQPVSTLPRLHARSSPTDDVRCLINFKHHQHPHLLSMWTRRLGVVRFPGVSCHA